MRGGAAVAVALLSCARERPAPSGGASPEAVARAFVAAADVGDGAAIARLFPPAQVVRRSVDCDQAVDEIAESRERVQRRVERGREQGVRVVFDRVEELGTERMAAGEASGECRALAPIEVRKLVVHFTVTMGGPPRAERQPLRVTLLGERWYLEGM